MEPKTQFEKYLKRSLSVRSWYRVRALMIQNSLTLTKANLKLLAKLKIESSRHKLPLSIALVYYLKTTDIQTITTGENLYQHLQRITDYKPHRTTIQRWFTEYQPNKVYTPSQVSQVLLSAFIYKLRSQNNASRQKPSRGNSLSVKENWSSSF